MSTKLPLALANGGVGHGHDSAAGPAASALRQHDRSMYMASDDSVMMKSIQDTHAPDGREIDVKPLLQVVEDILHRATMNVDPNLPTETQLHLQNIEDKAHQVGRIVTFDSLSYIIDRICCEMTYKSLAGVEGHATAVALFHLLSNYSWDTKLVLTLAAFALNYGEFWLLAQIYSSNQLARSMAILKQLPVIMEHSTALKPRFDALNNLIRSILELTNCIVAFKQLPSAYVSHDLHALSVANSTIPTAVYWNIRSIIACASQINNLTTMGHEYAISSTELSWELSTLAHKIKNIHEHLTKLLSICLQHIEDKKNRESYETLKQIMDMIHIDNIKVLRALIYARDDIQPLFDGSTKKRVSLDVLRRKNVLLLISGLDITYDELSILEQIYSESRENTNRIENLYEVVWMPIVDPNTQWTDALTKRFEDLRSTMTWYTVHHPSIIDRTVVRLVKERWHFRRRPILVVLDPQGKEVSPNALHMMWIWGSNAFPFTSLREEALWTEETWRLELLVDNIDPTILNWAREGKYIFLYGGDDVEWIRKFTTRARAVAQEARIPLEMVYVGKSSKREQVRKVISVITMDKLSYCWQDPTMIWFFWTRLESMLFSKIQLGKADDNEPMMQDIKKLLSYDKHGGWAVLSRGFSLVINGHATTVLPTLVEYDAWKENVPINGFDASIRDYHGMIHGAAHPCCRFEFPSTAGRIPEGMKCPECLRHMEKLITFNCCHDEVAPDALF